MELIRAEQIERIYNKKLKKLSLASDVKVLDKIDLSIKENEFISIMGRSGCGKTTLLKILGTIDKPTRGNLFYNGKNIKTYSYEELAELRRTKIGFVFQNFYLLPSLSIKENIMLPMILDGKSTNDMLKKVEEYAIEFGIKDILNKYPYEVSGGEMQRTAICRALANNPQIIFADEPTGNLDLSSAKTVINCLEKIKYLYKKTIVIVTHDPQIASFSEKVMFLKEGKIASVCEREQSKEEFYHKIMDSMNKTFEL